MDPRHSPSDSAASEAELLHAMGRALLEARTPSQGLDAALDLLFGHLSPSLMLLYTLQGQALRIRFLRQQGVLLDKEEGENHEVGECLCGWAAEQRKSLVVDEIAVDPRCVRSECKLAGIHSLAAMPLLAGEELIGLLTIGSVTPARYRSRDAWLEAAAATIALGLRNALLLESLQERMAQLEDATVRARRGEELFRTLVDNAPVMIDSFDRQGRPVIWNKECQRRLGYTLEEVLASDDPMALFYPDPVAKADALMHIRHGDGEFRDFSIRTRAGDVREQRWADFTLRGGDTIGIGIDVTEERAAQRALQTAHRGLEDAVAQRTRELKDALETLQAKMDENDAQRRALRQQAGLLQSVIDNIPYSVFWQDAAQRYLGCNTRFALDARAATPADVVGRTDEELDWGAENAAYFRAIGREVLSSGEARLGMLERLVVSGEPIIQETSLVPMRDAGGEVAGLLGIYADITRRQELEDQLRASEEKFRQLYTTMPDAFAATDLDGRIQAWNPAFARLLDYPEQLLPTLTYEAITPERWHADEAAIVAEIIAKDQPAFYEKEYVRRDGVIVPVALHTFLVKDSDGAPAGLAAVVRDISQQKQTEDALREASRRAEEASQAKSDFLARMSHEIRTPMNAILGMAQLGLDADTLGDCRQAMDVVREAAGSLMTILNDILDFSRTESSGVQLASEPVDVGRLLRAVAASLQAQAAGKGLTLRLEMDPDPLPLLLGDGTRLRQICFNLTHNAVKFTSQGEVILAARVESRPRGTLLHLIVRDTGIGIPADKLPHVFDTFYQADGGMARAHGGSGLGLSICRQLVSAMGGEIEATSQPGQGTTFHARIPTARAEGAAPSWPGETGSPEGQTTEIQFPEDQPTGEDALGNVVLPGAVRVLLVEDNALNRKVAVGLLRKLGLEPMVAADGPEALETLRLAREFVDVVLMDIEMPGMDGFEVLRRLRAGEAGEAGRHVPVVALTAHAMPGCQEECLARGMAGYVSKPVHLHLLRQALGRVLGQAPGGDPRHRTVREEADQPGVVASGAAMLDMSQALGRMEGDAILLQSVHRALRDDMNQRRRRFQEALDAEDLEALHRLAHNYAGALGMAGSAEGEARARSLAEAARDGDLSAAREALEALFSLLPSLREALERASEPS